MLAEDKLRRVTEALREAKASAITGGAEGKLVPSLGRMKEGLRREGEGDMKGACLTRYVF